MDDPEQDPTEPPQSGCGGCSVALALVFLPGVVLSVLTGPLPGEEWPFALFYGLLLAVPFAYLALDGTRHWLPWLVATLLTALSWGALSASVISSARDQTGANIGMGLLMLASPVVITVGAWLANRRT
jgi:hypothetical protein